jgi:hypothetical protein
MKGMHIVHSKGCIKFINAVIIGSKYSTCGDTIKTCNKYMRGILKLTDLSTSRCVNIVTIKSGDRFLNKVSKKVLFTKGSSLIGG